MNRWPEAWKHVESLAERPNRLRHIIETPWAKFAEQVIWQNASFVDFLTRSLYAGDAWILKGAFTPDFMHKMRDDTAAFFKSEPSSFHKMLDGCPDFHRIIDLEAGKKYAFRGCKHSAYFYPWNKDPLDLWTTVRDRWRIVKFAMGLDCLEYERNIPSDKVCDRIQVVRYPPAIGYLEPHADPYKHQRLFWSGYMSKRGVDYEGGGFYIVGADDQAIEIEDQLDVGDACIGYATVYHGVAPCDRHKQPDWDATDGRWFLSMYSNESDHVVNRHTGKPVKLNIPGVLP